MRFRVLSLSAALGVLALGFASFATAEDEVRAGAVVTFGDVGARFHVVRDADAGTMTFRLADDAKIRVTQAPVVVVRTPSGPREVTLVAVEGQPNSWRLADAIVRDEKFDGTMKISVDGRWYDAPIGVVTTTAPGAVVETKVVARHGGRVLTFPDCGGNVEVVQDPATGTLTVYSLMGADVKIVDAPVVTVTETAGPRTINLVRVDGDTLAWRVSNPVFRTTTTTARIRILVDGKPCETSLVASGSTRGGEVVTFQGGPRFEVVRDPKTNGVTFYQLDETIEGKPVVIEQPPVVVMGTQTYPLQRVEGEPRAWRLVGVEPGLHRTGDASLRLTLFGKSLETRLGLSGLGIDVK